MSGSIESYIPALRYRWLTRFYDLIVALTTREKRFKRQLIKQAKIVDGQMILDIGCGTGTLAIWIKQFAQHTSVFGLDGDVNILLIAAKKSQKENTDIQFDLGLSYELPYPAHSFDRVFSSLFFHHLTLSQKKKTVAEIYRVLKRGGELHIADWGKPSNVFMRLLFYQIQLLDGFETTRENVRGILPKLIQDCGFKAVTQLSEFQTIFGTLSLISAEKPG